MANTQSCPPSEMPRHSDRSDSTSSRSASAVSHDPTGLADPVIHAPTPVRPVVQGRSSGGGVLGSEGDDYDDGSDLDAVESRYGPDDVRAMSPRRTSKDLEAMGKEAREELKRQAQTLQHGLLTILDRIEAVREEHDKLDNHNKFLQKYIGDLMTTGKITATTGRGKK